MVAPILGRCLVVCGVLSVGGSVMKILPAYGNDRLPWSTLKIEPSIVPDGPVPEVSRSAGIPPVNLPRLDRNVEQQVPKQAPIRSLPPTLPQSLPQKSTPVEDDLGTLQLRPASPASPTIPIPQTPETPSASSLDDRPEDADLGDILIRPQPPIPPKPKPQPVPKSLYLIGRIDYFNTSNVLASPQPQTDGALRSGLSLYYAPSLGPKTFLLATTEAAMLRYGTLSRLNSDELRIKVGVYHQWTPKVSTEVGWSYYELSSAPAGIQQVFGGKRFFNEHSLRFDLIRQDELNQNLSLTSIYQFRWNLAGDVDQYDRLVNNAIASLSYKLSPRTQAAVDYQYSWTHFIQQSRDDQTHFLGVRLSHSVNDRLQLSTFGGRNFGYSSESRVNPVGWIFGFGLGVNLPIL
jgi:hypothetical protein